MLCMKELKSGFARAGSWPPIKDNRLGSSLVILQTASSNLHLPAHQIKWFTAAAVHYSQCHHDSTLSSQHHFLSAYLRHHPASTQRHFVQLRREINLVSAFRTFFTGSYYLQHQKKKKKNESHERQLRVQRGGLRFSSSTLLYNNGFSLWKRAEGGCGFNGRHIWLEAP